MSVLDSIGGDSTPSAFNKDDPIGTTVTGTVIKADIRQVRNYETNKPEFWDDGNPKEQLAVTLDIGDQQPRGLYLKTWSQNAKDFKKAVQDAGLSDILPGTKITATYAYDEANPDNPRLSATKRHTYKISGPSATGGFFADTTTGEVTQQPTPSSVPIEAPVQPALPAQPAPQPAAAAPAPAQGALTVVDQIKQMHALGLAPDAIKAALGNNPAVNDQVIAAALAA